MKFTSRMSLAFSLAVILASLGTCAVWASDNPFVGDWKLNPSRSKMTDQMKVESLGSNKYGFDFIGDGTVETIVVDGTDQPGMAGTTLSVTAQGSDAWKVVRKKDGKMLLTANWTLAKDGNTLTDDFTEFQPNGSPSNVKYVYQRTAGGSGFAATWVSTSETVNFVYVLQVQSYEGDGLTIIDSSQGLTRKMKLDGKDYPTAGENGATVLQSSLRRLDNHTLELTDKKTDGKVIDTQEIKLSADLKTLTATTHIAGRTDPQILVFERQ